MSDVNKEISALRENYSKGILVRKELSPSPYDQFKKWFDEAQQAEVIEPNAMTLATVSATNIPSARIVLLKEIAENGFLFYTNYTSEKAREIESNKNVALVFLWKEIERQVRITGTAEKISEEKSIQYFQSRPIKSQLGAWASNQSSIIDNREELESKMNDLLQKHKDQKVLSKPPHWGGYCVSPTTIEFWQGRRSRLHDRFRYTRLENNTWQIDRLSP